MQHVYRFCFFDGTSSHAAAVLVLHFAAESAAAEEAVTLLAASALARIEVWRGTRRVYNGQRAALPPLPVGAAASAEGAAAGGAIRRIAR